MTNEGETRPGFPAGFSDSMVGALVREIVSDGQRDPWLDSGDGAWAATDRILSEFLRDAARRKVKDPARHLVHRLICAEFDAEGAVKDAISSAAVRALDTYQLIEDWRRVKATDPDEAGYLPPENQVPRVLPLSLEDDSLYTQHSRSQILEIIGGELRRRGIPMPKES